MNDDQVPVVTIGLTCFNAMKTINRAIESAQAQNWPNIDIVVVDDCSTDGSYEFVQHIDGVRAFQQDKNSGVAAARNRILKEAHGAFICFFDDDDVSRFDRVILQYERICYYEGRYEEELVICHSAREQHYPDGVVRIEGTMGCAENDEVPKGGDVARRILYGQPSSDVFGSCATCSQMARREVYNAVGGFDDTLRRNEDTDLNIRLALKGASFAGVSEPLVEQYMNLSADKNLLEEERLSLEMLSKYQEFIDKNFDYNFCVDWMRAKFLYYRGYKWKFTVSLLLLFFRSPKCWAQKIIWAMPNAGYNIRHRKFFKQEDAT